MTTITPLPTPPSRQDPANFSDRADDFLGALPLFATEANLVAGEVNTNAATSTTQAGIATTQAGIATTQAGIATTKAGEALSSATLAEDWAIKTDAPVSGSDYSSKYYSLEAKALNEKYQGSLNEDPLLNKEGGPLTPGDWYVNSSTGFIRAYNGSNWVQGISDVAGVSSVDGKNGILSLSDVNYAPATEEEMQNGVESGLRSMSPLRVKQAITSNSISSGTIVQSSTQIVGWLPCDRANYLKSSYPNLFNVAVGNPLFGIKQRSSGSAAKSAAYGNGMYVVVGNNLLYSSPDGITWTERTSQFGTRMINDVTYGNGLFVAVGGLGTPGNVISTSSDGITWTSRLTASISFNKVAYGNGAFVAISNSALYSSTDGITWTERTSNIDSGLSSLTFANGLFVVGGAGTSGNAISTSSDGITWTARHTTSVSVTFRNIAYFNSRFIAITANISESLYSTDGVNWIKCVGSGITAGLYTAASSDVIFTYDGNGAYYYISYDGVNFISLSTSIAGIGSLRYVTFIGGYFVGQLGNSPYSFMISRDAVTWQQVFLYSDLPRKTPYLNSSGHFCSTNNTLIISSGGSIYTTTVIDDTDFNVPFLTTVIPSYIKG